MSRILFFLITTSFVFLQFHSLSPGQEAAPPPDPAPPSPAPLPAGVSTDDEPEILRAERSIYLPYEDLEAIFEKEGRGVFLPYREFLDLWNQLVLERKKDKEKPPADGVLSSAQYTAKIEGADNRVLAIDSVIEAESFKDEGWAVVPLAKAGLNIAEADTGEATLHLGAKGYELLLPKKGTYRIQLKLFAKLNSEAGKNDVRFHLPRAGVSRFEALIPEQGWDFELKPAAAYATQKAGQDTKLSFFFGETETFDVTWQKQGEETRLNPLLFVESEGKATLVPGALQTDLKLHYRVLRSGVDQFEIAVPAGQEILSVEGENIKEWDVVEADGVQNLNVSLHSVARKQYTLQLLTEQALESLPAEVSPPVIEAKNVIRQRGSILVENSPDLEIAATATEGLTRQSMAAAPASNNQASNTGAAAPFARFRFLTLPYTLTLSVKKAEPVVEVESWTRFTVEPDSSNFLARFDYEIKRAGIFGARIEIPAGFEGVEASGDQVKDFSEETVDGNRRLNVEFRNRVLGKTSFTVTGRQVRGDPGDDTVVPVFSPENVERHEGKIALSIHSSLDPRTSESGDLRQQEVALLGSQIPGTGPLQIGFRYRGTAAPATISYTLKKPQVSGEVSTLVEVREQMTRYLWSITWQIRYAGVDTFVFSLPESIAENLRHEGTLIKEVDKDYSAEGLTAPDGHVLWAVILRDKKIGSYQLKLNLDQPLGDPGEEDADASDANAAEDDSETVGGFPVSLPEIQLHQVQTETGQIAVIKDDSLEILDASTSALEPIDPKELRGNLARPGVFLSYKYRRHPLTLGLKVSRNEFLPVPQAVVTYADLTTVLSSDAAVTTEVIYWVKNNAKQFFSVTLPAGGKMVSDVYVNGQSRQPMRRSGEDVILIRLPAGEEIQRFPVRFLYEVPSPHPGKKLIMGAVEIPHAELTDAEVLQSRLKLYLPNGYSYRKIKSAMNLPLSERGWMRFRSVFDWIVPTLGPRNPVSGDGLWDTPPEIGKMKGGFDLEIPTGGQAYQLHRLDEPAPVTVVYRTKGYQLFIEALAALLAFAGAILFMKRPIRWRFLYFAAFGILPLIIAGAISPTGATFWTAIYLGTLFGALFWLARGLPRFLKYAFGIVAVPFAWWAKRRRESRAKKKAKAAEDKKEPVSEEG